MDTKKDYYKVLGLTESATEADIKKAYRKLAMKYHPDRNKDTKGTEEKFKEINEANSVLSDPEKKRNYDTARKFGDGGSDYSGYGDYEFSRDFHDSEEMNELFRQFFGNSDFRQTNRKRSLKANVVISFWESVFGCEREFEINTGSTKRKIKFAIPAGVDEHNIVHVHDEDVDLKATIEITPDPNFSRKGLDVYANLSIPLTLACLGGEMPLSHWEKDYIITIPECIQNGQKLRIGKAGIKKGDKVGDFYLVCSIEIPKKLTKKQKELLMEFQKTEETKPGTWFDSLKGIWNSLRKS